jgi:Mg-chelatase subunit ChlD
MILDRSGSMSSVRGDIIGGFNQLVSDQKKVPGKCTVTLVQFDSADPYEILRDMQDIAVVADLGDEYKPRSNTPLYDAVGRGIVNTGEKLAALPEHERPSKVVFVVLTDGLENASTEYQKARVAEMVKEQTEKYGWQFVFLGANQDAILAGAAIGVTSSTSADYDQEVQTSGAIQAASSNLAAYRTGNNSGMDFSPQQRVQLKSKSKS